jgi:uroporphyrinogen decarboxylase
MTMDAAAVPPVIAAMRGQPTPHTPVWVMRQAGRYLPEYRAVRAKTDFLSLTRTADLAAEVTLQPIRRFALDAAILFSDIMTPVEGMGVEIAFNPGPVIAKPVRTAADIAQLRPLVPERDVPFVIDSVRQVRAELPRHVGLIGFCGAPFTLFCYLVSGKPSKEFGTARSFAQAEPDLTRQMLDKLGDSMAVYLGAQVQAGAQAVMVFDTWGGLLGRHEYATIALPPVQRLMQKLKTLGVPVIYFCNNSWTLLDSIATLDVDVVGLDWRGSLKTARQMLGPKRALQGNLDPATLFAPPNVLRERVAAVLDDAGPTGHVFNLGHGIWPETDPDSVARLVDHVHEISAQRR